MAIRASQLANEPYTQLHVLVVLTGLRTCDQRLFLLAVAAVAACGALCAFTLPRRAEVLAAVKAHCALPMSLLMDVLHETAVLHAAEQQLAGTQAAC